MPYGVQFGRLPSILENALYRIVQEALTNACKHSKSKKVTVTMVQEGQDVRLEVRDWGIGFDPESVEKGPLRLGEHSTEGAAAWRSADHREHRVLEPWFRSLCQSWRSRTTDRLDSGEVVTSATVARQVVDI